jgi:hypothetical protein
LIEEDDIATLGIALAKLMEKDSEAVRIQAGQLPPADLPCGRFNGRIKPVILVEGGDNLERLHAIAREPTPERQVQTEPACILAEHPDGLGRRLSS